jgi:hypothetical protein
MFEKVLPRRLNRWLAVHITRGVGTMYCAYAFVLLTLVSAPAAFSSGSSVLIVSWISQTFLQLVFLPILAVGQAVLSEAGDVRAKAVYDDVTAILAELQAIQEHMGVQDTVLTASHSMLTAANERLAP